MRGRFKLALQRVVGQFGYSIRRIDRGVSLIDPYVEQQRLAGANVNVVFEVGAYDGRDCFRYLGLFPSARVFAFEPLPNSFDLLVQAVSGEPRIKPVNMAISDEQGRSSFHISSWADSSSLLKPKLTGSTFDVYHASDRIIEVDVDTLDAVTTRFGINRIDILKLDAQGAELKILRGAKRLISLGAIGLIYTEVHFLESYSGSARFDQIMSVLIEYGFELHNLYGLNHNQTGRLAWGDAIFVHKSIRQ